MVRNQRVPFAAIPALGLCRVTVDEKTVKHRMVHTANFVFNEKDTATIIGIDNFFKTILMVTHIFGNQAATLQVSIGPGEIGDIDRDMMPVVGCQRLIGLSNYSRLIASNFPSS